MDEKSKEERGLPGVHDRTREGVLRPDQGDFFGPSGGPGFPEKRKFQESAHVELRAGAMAGHQKQLLMAPTGSGKTLIALRICDEALRRKRRVLFICDRKTLINQTSVTADGYGMPPHGIIQADNPRMALWRDFQIASAQTIQARGLTDDFEVVIVDEAHTVHKAVTDFLATTKAKVIGLSATPFTKGLGKIYSRVVNAATMDVLVKQGVLVPPRTLSCVRPDMEGAKTSGGEWTAKEAEQRGMGIVGDVVLEWSKHANGLKTIVFGPTILHCEELVRQFLAAGIKAATFCATTKDGERDELLKEFRKPDSELRVLVSVEALAKGFDVRDVGCVVDCRPLRKSLSTWIQMIGRGLRCSPGKTECIVLDHSGNAARFANDFSDIYFNGLDKLDDGEKLDKEIRDDANPQPKSCPKCGYSPFGRRCVGCGFEPTRKSLIEHGVGEAKEFNLLGLQGHERYASSRVELFNALATYAKKHGHLKGSAAHKFRDITGAWPPSTQAYDFDRAPRTQPSEALLLKLRSLNIAYAKRRRES